MISKLQYITQGESVEDHVALVEELAPHLDWIQLRLKDVSEIEYIEAAMVCREITKSYDCKLIINDNVVVALASDADGVHLGQNDMAIKDARKVLGDDIIIGGTANTIEEIQEHYENGVDYVGVGPYQFTTTKKNLSPTLGIEGYQNLIEKMSSAQINIPMIAIGGIDIEDVAQLKRNGVSHFAFSGAITNSANRIEKIIELNKIIYHVEA